MAVAWEIVAVSEVRMRLIGEVVAATVRAGDAIALHGDLGVGKTTLSRYIIRALSGDDDAEVPSPTFTLVQTYDTPRFPVRHFDLYRLSDPEELLELDFEDERSEALTLIEWPDRAGDWLPGRRLDIEIDDREAAASGAAEEAESRCLKFRARGEMAPRLERLKARYQFIQETFDDRQLDDVRLAHLEGDASARSYATLRTGGAQKLLMDMPRMSDGPIIKEGLTYSQIAHLAEDAQPFVVIAEALRNAGLAAPEIYNFDQDLGLALIEDLGPSVFAHAIDNGVPQATLWEAAVDVLAHLRTHRPAFVLEAPRWRLRYEMPFYDKGVLEAELALFKDWYWPKIMGGEMARDVAAEFDAVWQPLITEVAADPSIDPMDDAVPEHRSWVLRDFHSPNLIWQAGRQGVARVGVIDFQDAQIGHAAYDLVSLALDARLDVPRHLHDALLDRYCARAAAVDNSGFDEPAFRRAAAILGAQRNTKILGIFARLSHRDGKHQYLRHLPRIRRYLGWCVEARGLERLGAWYRTHLKLADDDATAMDGHE